LKKRIRLLESEQKQASKEVSRAESMTGRQSINHDASNTDVKALSDLINLEESRRKKIQHQLDELMSKHGALQRERDLAEQRAASAELKQEVVLKFYREKEVEYEEKISDLEQSARSEADRRQVSRESDAGNVEAHRVKMDELRNEFQRQEAELRQQVALQEKKAHEYWLTSRQNEREAQEFRNEATTLKERIVQLEGQFDPAESGTNGHLATASHDVARGIPAHAAPPPFPPPFVDIMPTADPGDRSAYLSRPPINTLPRDSPPTLDRKTSSYNKSYSARGPPPGEHRYPPPPPPSSRYPEVSRHDANRTGVSRHDVNRPFNKDIRSTIDRSTAFSRSISVPYHKDDVRFPPDIQDVSGKNDKSQRYRETGSREVFQPLVAHSVPHNPSPLIVKPQPSVGGPDSAFKGFIILSICQILRILVNCQDILIIVICIIIVYENV